MMSKDLVTVIVPAYNMENYLNRCIDSIINQTYNQIEIIVVNDGSDDNTQKICEKYAQNRMIKYLYQCNSGVSVARNNGIRNAHGSYVAFVDGDDELEETYIEQLMRYAGDNTDIICCGCTVFGEKGEKEENFYDEDIFTKSKEENLVFVKQIVDARYHRNGVIHTAIGVPWGKLYKLDFLKKNNLFFNPDLRRMQDNLFNNQAFMMADRVVYIKKNLYRYRLDHIAKIKFIKNDNIYEIMKERYEICDMFNTYYDQELKMMINKEMYSWIVSLLLNIYVEQKERFSFDDMDGFFENKYVKRWLGENSNSSIFIIDCLIKQREKRLKAYLHLIYFEMKLKFLVKKIIG
jgi:glycosyltransferase involved in cell wall biosynthesis